MLQVGGETRLLKYLFTCGWGNKKKSGKICLDAETRGDETTKFGGHRLVLDAT